MELRDKIEKVIDAIITDKITVEQAMILEKYFHLLIQLESFRK
jgi:hypothetical protein